ncbi:MAG: zinc ABC transporter solute-binding protein [Synechococcaceae cyanobacterium SM1_2_3]|nr:zinc ABC transporter solute-binding protein [Synechococcaceae cyanobacterium SM1_2_3]
MSNQKTLIPINLLMWALLLASPLVFAAEFNVTVSIKPLHSLVAGVMQGVAEPKLLVQGGASPHDYHLKPSDTRSLNAAQVVFWIGPDLETFLVKPLNNLKAKVRAVALMEAPGVTVLPLREGGVWESHPHHHEKPHDHEKHQHGKQQDQDSKHEHDDHDGSRDAHIWLDPINAIAMVRQIVTVLSEMDAAHLPVYQRNGAALIERLNQLHQQLGVELAPIREQPYIVFHDAYQYFEQRYGLNAVGSVVLSPEQRPGAKRVAEIQARIRDRKVVCVFSEPQFQPALVETVIAGSSARRGVLDPEGSAELTAGLDAYFQLLQKLSSSLRTCLSGS